MSEHRMLPRVDDRDTQPFFAAAKQGKLVVRQCNACKNGIHPPTAHCPFCGSWDTAWRDVSGRGRLHTWSVVSHQVHPAYPTPYTLVVVELEDVSHVRLVGNLPGTPRLSEGMSMRVVFREMEAGVVLPEWEPAS